MKGSSETWKPLRFKKKKRKLTMGAKQKSSGIMGYEAKQVVSG